MRVRGSISDLSFAALAATLASSSVGAAQDPLRLPLTMLRNNPVIGVEAAGHEIKVLVDTGGGALVLSREALTQTGAVELAREPSTWTDASGQEHKARWFRVPQIRVGGRQFTNLEAIEAQESAPNGPPIPNVLGREFLRQFIVLVDYPGLMMTLLSPDSTDTEAEAIGCKGTRVPLERTSSAGLAITQVKLDGATMRLLWDTGATYSFLPAGSVTAYRLPVTPPEGQKPPFYNTKRLILGDADLGPIEFVVLPLQLPSDFEGMLGYNVFAKHVVCLNYGRGELRIR